MGKNFQVFICYNSNKEFLTITYTKDSLNIPYMKYEKTASIPLKDRLPIIMNMFTCNDYYTQISPFLDEVRYAYAYAYNNSMVKK